MAKKHSKPTNNKIDGKVDLSRWNLAAGSELADGIEGLRDAITHACDKISKYELEKAVNAAASEAVQIAITDYMSASIPQGMPKRLTIEINLGLEEDEFSGPYYRVNLDDIVTDELDVLAEAENDRTPALIAKDRKRLTMIRDGFRELANRIDKALSE